MMNEKTPGEKFETGDEAFAARRKAADRDFRVVAAMMAVLVVAGAITLLTIKHPAPPVFSVTTPNPSPFGYTWSLVLFIVPALALKGWFLRHPRYHLEKKPYWLTIAVLTPLGFCLDLFFGNSFFTFGDQAATLGVRLPGYTFGRGWVANSIPLEEFAFYFAGFITILLIYVWGNLYWFGAYNVEDYHAHARRLKRIVSFHLPLAVVAAVLIVAAILFKKFAAPPEYRAGFPGYFTFMVVAGIVPTTLLFEAAKPFVNWRAFSFSLFALLFLSLLWEGTMGVPYGWWGYQPERMMGIVIGPLASLPLEAVLLWFVATWITVMVYEVIRIVAHSERDLREALFGLKGTR